MYSVVERISSWPRSARMSCLDNSGSSQPVLGIPKPNSERITTHKVRDEIGRQVKYTASYNNAETCSREPESSASYNSRKNRLPIFLGIAPAARTH